MGRQIDLVYNFGAPEEIECPFCHEIIHIAFHDYEFSGWENEEFYQTTYCEDCDKDIRATIKIQANLLTLKIQEDTKENELGRIGLYGSMLGNWRQEVITRLNSEKIGYFDPTNSKWSEINDSNRDEKQEIIDSLVADQQEQIRKSSCIIFYLANGHKESGKAHLSLSSRSELGFLIGAKKQTFLYIEPDFTGRNYLWAMAKLHPDTVTICASLKEATEKAIEFVKEEQKNKEEE